MQPLKQKFLQSIFFVLLVALTLAPLGLVGVFESHESSGFSVAQPFGSVVVNEGVRVASEQVVTVAGLCAGSVTANQVSATTLQGSFAVALNVPASCFTLKLGQAVVQSNLRVDRLSGADISLMVPVTATMFVMKYLPGPRMGEEWLRAVLPESGGVKYAVVAIAFALLIHLVGGVRNIALRTGLDLAFFRVYRC